MKFNIYILISAAFLWFTFASMFLYRSTWSLERAKYYKGEVEELGVKYIDNSDKLTLFTFKLEGLKSPLGIYKKKIIDYDTFLNNIHIGDVVSVYYDDWNYTKGDVNLQVVQLESNDKLLIDFKTRKRKDLMLAIILYFISAVFIFYAWFLRQKQLRDLRNVEYYHLGMNMYM